jgi:hypothetical protein
VATVAAGLMLVGVNAASASSSTETKFVNTQIAYGW